MAGTAGVAILHISDVHFAPILANNRFPWIKGWPGHDLLLCTAISVCFGHSRTHRRPPNDRGGGAFSWVLRDIRKIDIFPVRGKLGIYEVTISDHMERTGSLPLG
jgi:hypothetical protein